MARILLVDDDENALRVVSEKLRSEGMDVLIATGGQEGIDKAKQERPDLVITDLMMPEINGYAVARAIREDVSLVCTPIIMLTAQSQVDEVIKGLAMGADDYIVKPFGLQELLARVNALLRMRDFQIKSMEAERMKALLEMAGAAAHEINQPLTVIMGYADMIQKRMEKQDQFYEFVTSIYKNSLRISEIIKKLQSIRRYESKPYIGNVNIMDFDGSSKTD